MWRGTRIAPVCAIVALATQVGGAAGKGAGPTSIAAGYDSVWVGFGNGRVISLPTSLVATKGALPGRETAFVHGLTARYGGLWVLRDRVTFLDPRSNTARDVPGTSSGTGLAIAAGAGAIWVADDRSNRILRIDPRKVRVLARIGVSGRAWGVAAGGRNVIVVSVPTRGPVTGPEGRRVLSRLDPRTDRLSRPLARVGCDVGVAVGSRAVWTFDVCSGVLARRDPRTLRVVRQRRTGLLSQVPALGFGSLWLASRGGVFRVDPRTLRFRARISARSLMVVTGAGFVWAFDSGADRRPATIRKIDPGTDRVVATIRIAVLD
jgi:DNA-binding beta-propeller fold protein YncE